MAAKEKARVCDLCGEMYHGEQYGPYGDNICPDCLEKEDSLPLVDEGEELPDSVKNEFEGEEEDGD